MLGSQTFEVLHLLNKRSRQSLKFEFVGMFSINKYSCNFVLSKDLRNEVIQMGGHASIK